MPMGLLRASYRIRKGLGCLWDSCGSPLGFQKDQAACEAPMGLLRNSQKGSGCLWGPMGLLKDSNRIRMPRVLLWASYTSPTILGRLWDSYGAPIGFLQSYVAYGAPMGVLNESKRIRIPMGLLWVS